MFFFCLHSMVFSFLHHPAYSHLNFTYIKIRTCVSLLTFFNLWSKSWIPRWLHNYDGKKARNSHARFRFYVYNLKRTLDVYISFFTLQPLLCVLPCHLGTTHMLCVLLCHAVYTAMSHAVCTAMSHAVCTAMSHAVYTAMSCYNHCCVYCHVTRAPHTCAFKLRVTPVCRTIGEGDNSS